MANLTKKAFDLLLEGLDTDPDKAADKYSELRTKLARCLSQRGYPEARRDDLIDDLLDRVAGKLESGEQIENVAGFAYRSLHFVWLEKLRKNKEEPVPVIPDVPVMPELPEDVDHRVGCLRSCMAGMSDADRRLIIGYYDNADAEKLKDRRRSLAEDLGLKLNALKVRACRLRDKLEVCINSCVEKRLARVTN